MTIRIMIDPGHGGKDPGAVCKDFAEKDKVLKMSLVMAERLKENKFVVGLTRSKDEYLDSTTRVRIVNDFKANLCISNHINSAPNIEATGAEIIHSIFSKGKLATNILENLVEAGANKRRVYTKTDSSGKDHFFMNRLTNCETVIIEYGFLSNANDVIKLNNNWSDYIEAVVMSVCNYFGVMYIPPVKPIIDIDRASDWATISWEWAAKNGITNGKLPQGPPTREQVAEMLYRYNEFNKSGGL